jgi:mannose/fructose/N-acetylgalactosamine-specific phosphotransferase system component IIC
LIFSLPDFLDFILKPLALSGVLYAFLSLDHIAAGHFMLSRPIVVGPLVGWALGDGGLGLLAGIIVELMWVHVIPVGIWPVDTTAMAGLSITWTIVSGYAGRPALVVALLMALPAGMIVRYVDIAIRRRNEIFIPWITRRLEAGDETVLWKAVSIGIFLWFVKAWVLFVVLGFAGQFIVDQVLVRCPARLWAGLDFAGRTLPLLALGSVMNYFFTRRGGLPWPEKPPTP